MIKKFKIALVVVLSCFLNGNVSIVKSAQDEKLRKFFVWEPRAVKWRALWKEGVRQKKDGMVLECIRKDLETVCEQPPELERLQEWFESGGGYSYSKFLSLRTCRCAWVPLQANWVEQGKPVDKEKMLPNQELFLELMPESAVQIAAELGVEWQGKYVEGAFLIYFRRITKGGLQWKKNEVGGGVLESEIRNRRAKC